eukprot:TRINITY_DN24123_c0_g1_i2.p1 TRINITY_DN24123_c0_g1~~TRINITY_DN24123_c0_g1_i2.p1  ORF type:complete len:192 (+),score=-17.59 TRINITY_DN24123_c0_g1_i2:113-688(+)
MYPYNQYNQQLKTFICLHIFQTENTPYIQQIIIYVHLNMHSNPNENQMKYHSLKSYQNSTYLISIIKIQICRHKIRHITLYYIITKHKYYQNKRTKTQVHTIVHKPGQSKPSSNQAYTYIYGLNITTKPQKTQLIIQGFQTLHQLRARIFCFKEARTAVFVYFHLQSSIEIIIKSKFNFVQSTNYATICWQ